MIVTIGLLIAAFPPLLLWIIFYKTPLKRYFAHSSEVEAAVIGTNAADNFLHASGQVTIVIETAQTQSLKADFRMIAWTGG